MFIALDTIMTRQDFLHNRSSDEYRGERSLLPQKWQVQRRLEAFRLSAEMIPIHSNIEAPNELLTTFLGTIGRLGE